MTKTKKEEIKQIVKRYELFGSNTVTSLWEWALQTVSVGRDKNDIESMLREIGEQIRRERYNYDVLLAGYHQLQQQNNKLRQLPLFPNTHTD